MDTEDRDHFKTIAGAQAELLHGSPIKRGGESLNLVRDPAYCLDRATMLFGCYRKNEVADPEIYCSAVAAVLSEYPKEVIDRVTDPRTGLPSDPDSKYGVPNVGAVRSACDREAARMAMMAEPPRRSQSYVQPPMKAGQITSGQFFELVKQGKVNPRPIGAFDVGAYLGPSTSVEYEKMEIRKAKMTPEQRAEALDNAKAAAAHIAAGEIKISNELANLLRQQYEQRRG